MSPALRSLRLANGVRLHYAEQGDPGGMPVADAARHHRLVALLRIRCWPTCPASLHVFALSQRGHGESDRPGRYRTRDFAADAAAFIEALDLGPALVVGHSMGSANAMRLAIDRPDLVRGLVAAGAFAGFRDKAELVEFHRSAIEPLRDPIDPGFAAEWQRARWRNRCRPRSSRWSCASACARRRPSGATPSRRCSTTTSRRDAPHRRADAASSGAIATRCARSPTRSGSSGRSKARACSPTKAPGMRCIGKQPARFAGDLASFASTVASPALSEETLQ